MSADLLLRPPPSTVPPPGWRPASVAELKTIRLEQGTDQATLEDRIGVAHTQISRWEREVADPALRNYTAWAAGLGFDVLLRHRGRYRPATVAELCAIRLRQDVRQTALARRIGVDGGQISKWERGLFDPGMRNFVSWAAGLGCAVVLCARTGPHHPLRGHRD